jgi:hypothetical protein
LIICNESTRERRQRGEEEEEAAAATRRERERERERTKRAARKDTARIASIADKAVAHFLKFQRRRARRPTANAELQQQLFRTSPAVLSM